MEEQHDACPICNQISLWRKGENSYFIHEFKNSIFVVGNHQFHKGYSLVFLKNHVRELHELPQPVQAELFHELMIAAGAIAATFQPWKLNYACYGNVVPHIHWHIIPRYESDPDRLQNPWVHSSEFDKHLINQRAAQDLADRIRQQLHMLLGRRA
ncbi:MAG: HIT family protein [Candidatus Aureabacteria bacterium]|nr:HIT family protein [Candidatus Auribacterota bacterium]